MTKEKLDEQISLLLAVLYVTMASANLMKSKIQLLMFQANQTFSSEAKRNFEFIKSGLIRIGFGLDFFMENALPTLVTDDGKTDYNSTTEALLKDANQVVRTLCQMYNKNVKSTKISDEIINSFNLGEYEDKRANNPGNSEST